MKVLVTGADGYIGTLLTSFLIEKGHNIVGLDTGFFKNDYLYENSKKCLKIIKKIYNF